MDYTQAGTRVSMQSIPPVPGSTQYQSVSGLSVDPSGNVQVFENNLPAYLATLSKSGWSFQTTPGWGIGSNITYGEVAAYKNDVFASNMQTLNGVGHGIVRFDSSGGAPVLFADGTGSLQLTLGLDGLLYELVGNGNSPAPNPTIEAFNPDTLALVRTIRLSTSFSSDIRSIAVDGSGNIYAADWEGTLTKYDPNGTALKTQTGYTENLMNVAIDTDGTIAVGGRNGGIYLSDESLSSLRAIQTGQWNVFVTFDHYIGTAPQTVTPSFSSLAGPTISYGQSSVTLGGTITAGAYYPPGSVNITVNGVTESAAINSSNGTFSASFNTSTLGVSGSPYTITYKYAGEGNYAAITDTSKSSTVNQAVTTLTNLSSPTIVYGTPSTTLSGTLGTNSVLPVGQSMNVTLTNSQGTVVASGSGTIASSGPFSANINTASLDAGSYTIQYRYAGDNNFQGASDSSKSLTISPATTSLNNLSSPTVVYGTPSVTLSGTVGSNSVLPVGQTVSVILSGANGPVEAGSGNIGIDGHFDIPFDTGSLDAGPYTILYSYAGDTNFQGTSDSSKLLTVSQATTSLSNLSSPIIVYGTSSVTLSGTLSSNSILPVGQSVTATILGTNGSLASGSGTIDSNGQFAIGIDTLGLSAGSYTIQYSYAGDSNFASTSDSSKTLTVSQAITSLSNLSSPTIVCGNSPTAFSGTVGSNSVLPVGQSVTVTLTDSKGSTVGSGNGKIGSDGSFQVGIDTTSLAAGSYMIQYSYAGDNNFQGTSNSSKTLTVKQAMTSLSNLSAPTIVYGAAATFSGTIAGVSTPAVPAGEIVTVTLTNSKGTVVASSNGTIANNGTFQANVNTASLGVGSYTIQYSYAGDSNFASTNDSSKSLTISQATTTLLNLSSPTIARGTPTTTLSGTITAASTPAVPAGEIVTVTLTNSKGKVVGKGNATIGSNGQFSVSIATGALSVGTYTIHYSYAGDSNFKGSNGTGTLQVTRGTAAKLANGASQPALSGTASPIQIQATDDSGNDLSSANLSLTAISIVGPNETIYSPQAKSNDNPGR
jgi:hypothetical protein